MTTKIAGCSDGCFECSSADPSICTTCFYGRYLDASTYSCRPCDANSQCYSCNQHSPAICTQCFPDSFMTSSNTCQKCAYPCASCSNSDANNCSSCVQGWLLV